MKDKRTIIVKYDMKKEEVMYENLNEIVSGFIKVGADFELVLIDENNIIVSSFNTIVNKYIADCKKEERPLCVYPKLIKEFIVNLMKYNNSRRDIIALSNDESKIPMDIIAPNQNNFVIFLPKELINEEKYRELLGLGPDYLKGGLPLETIFEYVLAPFYLFLYKYDLFDDEKNNDLSTYMYGLH